MTDYAPRNSLDLNSLFANPHLAMSHYSNGNGVNYVYNHGSIHYPTTNPSYPNFSAPYVPSQNASTSALYIPSTSSMALHYQQSPARSAILPSQPQLLSHPTYFSQLPSQRSQQSHSRYSVSSDSYMIPETESQDSFNEASMLSEPVIPAWDGYPDVKEFDELMKCYVQDLSPKKQDKALIHARRAANIKAVLIDKKTTSVESAQFRFWVKKMFTLMPIDPKIPDRKKKICHEGKPVAVREKLFKILSKAHKQCQHGGRDKTSAQVRKVYSWVPKELISRFVKLCPTCQTRRGAARFSPPNSEKTQNEYMDGPSPDSLSPSQSRRSSVATSRSSVCVHSPLSMAGFSSTFQSQNRWMTPLQPNLRPMGLGPGSAGGIITPSFNTLPSHIQVNASANPSTNTDTHSLPSAMAFSNSLNTLLPSSGYPSEGDLQDASAHQSGLNSSYISGTEMKIEPHY